MDFLENNIALTASISFVFLLTLFITLLVKNKALPFQKSRNPGLANISEVHLRTLIENATDAFFIHDFQGKILDVNKAAYERLGYTRDEILSLTVFDVEVGEDPEKLKNKIWPSLVLGNSYLVHGKHQRKDGSLLPVNVNITCLESNHESIIFALAHDTTKAENLKNSLQKLALTDELTNLPNRRSFMESMEKELSRSRRNNAHMSLLMIDIDHFKNINDTYGHTIGDTALKAFSDTTRTALRNEEVIGRLGGEEFGVLLANTTINDAHFVANKLRLSIEKIRLETPEAIIQFTASIGVASISSKHESTNGILRDADTALYQAKEKGRNRVVIYNTDE